MSSVRPASWSMQLRASSESSPGAQHHPLAVPGPRADERIETHRIAGRPRVGSGAAGPCRSRWTAVQPATSALHRPERGGSMVTPGPAAGTEFWRDIKPIDKEKVFRKDAAPELFLPDTMSDDDRLFVPLSDTVFSRPLWISLAQNRWADVLMAKQPGLVNRHYHPHQIFGYTLSGQWSYLEHYWVATAGTFVYEAPGEAHTLVAHESPEPMRVHFNVTGPLIWLDEDGQPSGTFDAYDYLELAREHYETAGLGAEAVNRLLR